MTRTWLPQLTPPLTTEDLDSILADALRVLHEIGVACEDETVGRQYAAFGGGHWRDGRAHFAPKRVREYLEGCRAAVGPPASDDRKLTLGNCWAGLNYCDPETLQVRPATTHEAAQMARLWDSRGLSGVVPLQPGDVPPAVVTLTAEKIALTHSRFLGGALTVMNPDEVRCLIDMNLAAGRRYHLVEQVGISPLRINCHALKTALLFRELPDVDVHITSFIPMAGASCPVEPRAALVQGVAETLAYSMLCATLGFPGPGLHLRVDPFDFQYSAVVFGSPEWCLLRAATLQLSGWLPGTPVRSGSFRSVSKRPDEQAACERTAAVLWQALLGVRHFGAVGQLSVDEVFSPQQAVLDREILSYVQRVLDGLPLDDRDPLALIAEGVAAGSFAGLDDTAHRFRNFYRFPEMFRHWNVGRWRAEGMPDILAEAWSRAREEIATSTYQLPEEQEREVTAIYERGCRAVG